MIYSFNYCAFFILKEEFYVDEVLIFLLLFFCNGYSYVVLLTSKLKNFWGAWVA